MIATIMKEFSFSAAHHLCGLPEDHQCARVHGHNYIVRVEITGVVDEEVGFVIDYGELKPFGEFLDREFDHRDLNDVMISNPTAEHLACVLTDVLRGILREAYRSRDVGVRHPLDVAVHVSETPKTWAICREKW